MSYEKKIRYGTLPQSESAELGIPQLATGDRGVLPPCYPKGAGSPRGSELGATSVGKKTQDKPQSAKSKVQTDNLTQASGGDEGGYPDSQTKTREPKNSRRPQGTASASTDETIVAGQYPTGLNTTQTTGPTIAPRNRGCSKWSKKDDETLAQLVSEQSTRRVCWAKITQEWSVLKERNVVSIEITSKEILKRRYYRLRSLNKTKTLQQETTSTGDPPEETHKKADRWSAKEDKFLITTARANLLANGQVNWNKVHEIWEKDTPQKQDKSRTKNALRARYLLLAQSQDDSEQTEITERHIATDPSSYLEEITLKGWDEEGKAIKITEDEFCSEFEALYKKVRKNKNRLKINKPNGKIPEPMLKWMQQCVTSRLKTQKVSDKYILQLNELVYTGASLIAKLLGTPKKTKTKANKERSKEALTKRDELQDMIRKIDTEIARRREKKQASKQEAKNRKWLQENFPSYKSSCKLKLLREMFAMRLRIAADRIKADEDERIRRKERFMSTKWLLLDTTAQKTTPAPPVQAAREYWKEYIGQDRTFSAGKFLKEWAKRNKIPSISVQDDNENEMTMWTEVCKKTKPWKATGPDQIHGFWWKLDGIRQLLHKWIVPTVTTGSDTPQWLSQGRAILLYKSGDTGNPGNYRTISCLNTCYKMLTAYITRKLEKWTEHLIPTEQLAQRKGIWGCTQAHIIDAAVCKHAKIEHKNLSMAWFDYSKAFDSIPHAYIRWILKNLNIPEEMRKTIRSLMRNWQIRYEGRNEQGKLVQSNPLQVKSGVLQGDTLSPYLFCLCVAPLSTRIRTAVKPYSVEEHKFSHIYYMDDLKVYTTDSKKLQEAINMIARFSKSIGLNLNEKKCATLHLTQGVCTEGEKYMDIPEVSLDKPYKYLGIEQHVETAGEHMWERITRVCLDKTEQIFSTQMTVRQKIQTFNNTVVPKVSFIMQNDLATNGRHNSQVAKARRMDEEIRTILRKTKLMFAASLVSRVYLSPEEGGLGLKRIEEELKVSKLYAWAYLHKMSECSPALKVLQSIHDKGKRTILSDVNNIAATLDLREFIWEKLQDENMKKPGDLAREIATQARTIWAERIKMEYQQSMWGNRLINAPGIDRKLSFLWLQKGSIGNKVARNILAAQENQLRCRSHPSNTTLPRTCRLKCKRRGEEQLETTAHILSLCEHWRDTLMVRRHNAVARALYYELCQYTGLQTFHYRDTIPTVQRNSRFELFWDFPVQTHNVIRHNRPDIILVDDQSKTIYICEIAVSWAIGGGGIPQMETRKYSKYGINSNLEEDHPFPYPAGHNLKDEMNEIYKAKVVVVPIVIGACGEISRKLKEHIAQLPLENRVTERLMERLARAAVEGSNLIICRHLGLE